MIHCCGMLQWHDTGAKFCEYWLTDSVVEMTGHRQRDDV